MINEDLMPKLAKINDFLFFVALFTLLITIPASCKKYPEDEALSSYAPGKRLSAHKWSLAEFYINGADSAYKIYNSGGGDTLYWQLGGGVIDFSGYKQIKRSDSYISKFTFLTYYSYSGSTVAGYNPMVTIFTFSEKKKKIWFQLWLQPYKNYPGFYPNYLNSNLNSPWLIKKLTEDEFILEQSSHWNRNLKIVFKKI